jgi:hypothetical protein
LDIDSEPDRLAGQYHSDRRTTGDMTFRRVSRKLRVGQKTAPKP